jgi:hypothetical protein|uniref:Uncharacterized protein n=1 Tax=Populus trichocarpa TaxID=3694 RepID=A0A3N7EK21_POPTR
MPIPKEVQPEPLLLPPMLLAPTTGLDAPEGGAPGISIQPLLKLFVFLLVL